MKSKGFKKFFSLIVIFTMIFTVMVPIGAVDAASGPTILSNSAIANGAMSPSIVVTLDGSDTFATAAGNPDASSNWAIDVGTTNLTVNTITIDTSKQATITFNGQAKAGTVAVTALKAAVTGASGDSNIINVIVPSVTISTLSTVVNADVNPSIVITLANSTFKDPQSLANWTINYGTTSLTAASITRDSASQATIMFTGTAGVGTISIQAKAQALNGLDDSNSIDVVVASVTNEVTISENGKTNMTASDISTNGASIDITLKHNKWNKNITINGASGPIYTNLYPTLKSCFTTTANSTQWSTLLDSASFVCSGDLKTITMTIPAQSYNIQTSQAVTFTPQTSLLQDFNIGTPVTQPSFGVTADYATVSGTLTSGATQSKMISGGQTLIIKLTNCTWKASIINNNDDDVKTKLLTDLKSSVNNDTEWTRVINALKSVTNPIALSSDLSTMTITFPAVPDYNDNELKTITLDKINMTLLTDTNISAVSDLTNIVNNSFVISPDTSSTTLSWAVQPSLTESTINTGSANSNSLSIKLSNNSWASGVLGIASDKNKQKALLDGFTVTTDLAAWNNLKAAILASGTFTLTSADTLQITLPTASYILNGGYNISADQIVTVKVPSTVLANNYAPSNTLSFTIIADSAVALTGSLITGATEMDIVNGGKTVVATLTNATWASDVTTDITKREKLIDELLDYTVWPANAIATIKAGATYTLTDAKTVTITLPPVSDFDISTSLVIMPQQIDPSLITSGLTLPYNTSASFKITPISVSSQSAAISGTVTTATESDIVAGGKTLVITLKNDVWSEDVVSKSAAIAGGISGMGSLSLSASNVVRTSDTVLTITLPAVPTYTLNGDTSVHVTIPKTLLTTYSGVSLDAGTFTVKAVTVTLSGTAITAPLDSKSVVSGGKTIIITLKNATWASDVITAKLSDLISCFSSSPNWNTIKGNITQQNITLSGKNVLTIKLPPVTGCTWNNSTETVSFSYSNSNANFPALITEGLSTAKMLADPQNKIQIGQTAQSSITASLSLSGSASLTSSDVVNGGKKIIITLTGGTWDSALPTNSSKISSLVSGFTADVDSTSWAVVQTALKSAGLVTNNPFALSRTVTDNDTLTITLPAVPDYAPVQNQAITLKTIPKTVLNSATSNVTNISGSIIVTLPSTTSKGTLESLLGGGLAQLINTVPLQQIYLVVPTKHITSVVVQQSSIGTNIINSFDIYTVSSVGSVSVSVNGTNYSSSTSVTYGKGKRFNVGFATVKPTTGSVPSFDATISSSGSGSSVSVETIKVSGSKTFNFTDLGGKYSFYKLVNNQKLLTNILNYYLPEDITVETV